MLIIVIAKPIEFTIVKAVPFNFEGAFCATKVEKSGESAMTTMPQTVGEADKYENPLGIRITDMAVKFRGTQASVNDKGE